MEGSEEVQFPTALLKDVCPTQPLGRVHQSLFHARWVYVGVVYGAEEQGHGPGNDRGSHAGTAQRPTAPVKGGASDAGAIGDDVWLHSPVASRQLLHEEMYIHRVSVYMYRSGKARLCHGVHIILHVCLITSGFTTNSL